MVRSAFLTVFLVLYSLPAMAATCENLASVALPNATISLAQTVPAAGFVPPAGTNAAGFKDLPAFCRVVANLKPSSDSDINIEVWLPAAGWNGNFQPAGNGNWGGSINFGEMANILKSGFATASTDTGHAGSVANFAYGHPEKLVDFGYRAFHEMTVAAKTTSLSKFTGLVL